MAVVRVLGGKFLEVHIVSNRIIIWRLHLIENGASHSRYFSDELDAQDF